MGQLTNTAFF